MSCRFLYKDRKNRNRKNRTGSDNDADAERPEGGVPLPKAEFPVSGRKSDRSGPRVRRARWSRHGALPTPHEPVL